MAVAELVKREAEQRPEDTPKVNAEGIEEMVAICYQRRGLGAGEELRSAYFTFRKRNKRGSATGRAKPRSNSACTRITGKCAAATAKAIAAARRTRTLRFAHQRDENGRMRRMAIHADTRIF